ncbi:MAG: hypothetical protein MI919_14755 [Holophagales bacterium]|nr:hypothetical protein [Holophagales bacterium]
MPEDHMTHSEPFPALILNDPSGGSGGSNEGTKEQPDKETKEEEME